MTTNYLPLNVIGAIVARFDPNLDELHFSHREVNIRLNNDSRRLPNGSWVVSATHISGEDLIIQVSPNLEVTFEVT